MQCENCNKVFRGLNQSAINEGAGRSWVTHYQQHWVCWDCVDVENNPYLAHTLPKPQEEQAHG